MEKLFSLKGLYTGKGINHEGQSFKANFKIKTPAAGKGMAFTFEALGEGQTVFHSECSIIGMAMNGKPSLWVLSNNHPGVFERPLKSQSTNADGCHEFIFAFGNRDERNTFREEIKLVINPDRSLGYTYFWGMPGGEFAERSGCKMMAN